MSSSRNIIIDNIKGIGIMLVVFAHICYQEQIVTWIYSFHMPLFFVVSGYVFYNSSKKNYIKNKINRIVIPYFIFASLEFIYWILIERDFLNPDFDWKVTMINILLAKDGFFGQNGVLWFVPCLFSMSILFYLVWKVFLRDTIKVGYSWANIVLLIIITLIGYLATNYIKVAYIWCLDISVKYIVFFTIGYFIHALHLENQKKFYLLILSIVVSVCLSMVNRGRIEKCNNYFMFIIGALGGIYFTYFIALIIGEKNNFIAFIGKNSMIIMFIHSQIYRIILFFFSNIINISIIRESIIGSIIITIVTIFICCPISSFINLHLPWMLGQIKWKELV